MACADDTRATAKTAAIHFVMISSFVVPAAAGGSRADGARAGPVFGRGKAAQDAMSDPRPRPVKTDSGSPCCATISIPPLMSLLRGEEQMLRKTLIALAATSVLALGVGAADAGKGGGGGGGGMGGGHAMGGHSPGGMAAFIVWAVFIL